MTRIARVAVTAGLLAASTFAARPARAADPTTADCLSATESSLALRNQHKLREARAKLLVCSANSCPADIRNECIRRVAEVNVAIPTIVFEARDAAGDDLGAVRVTIDGDVLAERLEGIGISVDPGPHTFVFATPGQATVKRQLLIREGEKDRRERIVFGPPVAAAGAVIPAVRPDPTITESSTSAAPSESERHFGTQRTLALATAGVGLVGVGVGIGFGLDSMSKHNDATKACPGQCATQHGVDLWNQARSAGNVSTVAFIVGAVGLAGGAVLWFTDKPEDPGSTGTQVGFGLGSFQVRGVW